MAKLVKSFVSSEGISFLTLHLFSGQGQRSFPLGCIQDVHRVSDYRFGDREL